MNIHRVRFVDYTPHTVTALSFGNTSTGPRLAVGRSNGDIEIWNPRYNWIHEQTLRGGKGRTIEGLVWVAQEGSPSRLFSIGGSASVTEWDLTRGVPLNNFDCNAGVIWSLAVSDNNEKLAVGCDNGTVVLLDVSGGPGSLEYAAAMQKQNSRVLSVAFSEKYIVGGCADGKIRCWDLATKRIAATMKVEKSVKKESTLVWSVCVLKNRNQIVTGDSTGAVKFWDLKHFTLLQTFASHQADVLCLAVDNAEEKVFSSGVDRKIINFSLVKSADSKQWISTSSKLVHGNDVRSMAIYESKNLSILASGGVGRQVVVNSVKYFQSNIHRKLPIVVQCQNNLANHSLQRFLLMWQDQSVKIWKISKSSYKLVGKLNMADQENIASVAISHSGKYLAVGYSTSVKMFKLHWDDKAQKVEVKKLKDLSEKLSTALTGAKLLQFAHKSNAIAICDYDNSVSWVQFDDDDAKISQLCSYQDCGRVDRLAVSENDVHVAVSNFEGKLCLCKAAESSSCEELAQLASPVAAMKFSKKNTLVVVTVSNSIYELETAQFLTFTEWSKRNSDRVPQEFVNLPNKCIGIYNDAKNSDRYWFWGADWLCSLDKSADFKKSGGLKRKHDGLTYFDDDTPEIEKVAEIAQLKSGTGAMWITDKYDSLLFAGNFENNDMVVVERSVRDFAQSAFKANQIVL